MTNVAALPALALIAGAATGVYAPLPLAAFVVCAVLGWLTLTVALIAPVVSARSRRLPGDVAWIRPLAFAASMAGFFGAGAALAADATREALNPAILADSHAMRADVVGASGAVPVVLSGVIRTDASATEFGAMFTLAAETIRVDGVDRETAGTVRIAVSGTSAGRHIDEWRAGRRVRVTATLAAPQPYLNIGTTNQETRLALSGIRLFGSVKSAAQVELLARGRWWDEAAASVRAGVRRASSRHVAPRDPQSAAIVTAVLIGDRAGLDPEVEERLQRAGTFHVIAISGGNIAILTVLILGLLRLIGLSPRVCAWLTLAIIGLYAFVVGSGASVARAALAAIVYLFARAIDHRTPALNVLAVVVAVMLVWAPLEIVDAGFWLTCLATLAIMLLAQRLAERVGSALRRITSVASDEAAPPAAPAPLGSLASRARPAATIGGITSNVGPITGAAPPATQAATITGVTPNVGNITGALAGLRAPLGLPSPSRTARPVNVRDWRGVLGTRFIESAIGLLAATVAAEVVLLPVTAYAFSQVSIAGLLLNFLAIPLMTIVQVAGIAIVLSAHALAPMADIAGVVVDLAARGIVASSRLVDAVPWSAPRVPPPPLWLLLACQASLCAAWFCRPPPWRRRIAAGAWVVCVGLVVAALPLPSFTLHAIGSQECQMTDSDRDRDRDAGRGGDGDGDSVRDFTRDVRPDRDSTGRLRVTFLDVAQGDATLIRFPDGRVWLVDAGGALGRFDIGTRIVSPALWALGLRRLSTLVLTHGDRDHIGGAHAVLRDFRPGEVWEGVPVEGHEETLRLRSDAARRRVRWRVVHSGERIAFGGDRAWSGSSHRQDDRHGDRAGSGSSHRQDDRHGDRAGSRSSYRDDDRHGHRAWSRGSRRGDDRHGDPHGDRARRDGDSVEHRGDHAWNRSSHRDDDRHGDRAWSRGSYRGDDRDAHRHGDRAGRRDADRVEHRRVTRDAEGDDDTVDVDVRVWNPSAPEWIRTRVRNDDSIVLELALGNVSLILPGDIGPSVERVLAVQHASPGQPSPATRRVATVRAATYAPPTERSSSATPLRVLKVPHHGSRTSSTAPFLDALQPRLAIVSAGRGNRHGHPAPAALARYAARGTEVFRTDQDGAIQLDTDGHTLTVRTCSGRRLSLEANGHAHE